MSDPENICEHCKHFCIPKHKLEYGLGECRIRAPTVAPINKAILSFEHDDRSISAQNFETTFPRVSFNLWCSEWARKLPTNN